jgi:excisionase family DNA binding protein
MRNRGKGGSGNVLPAGSSFTPGRQEIRSNTGENVEWRHPGAGIDRAFLAGMGRSVLVIHAAALLGVSRRTVYYRIRAGALKTIRTRCGSRRVLMESIEALLRNEVGPIRVQEADVAGGGP